MPADSEVLSVEFKLNLLRPADGERFVARGRVLRAGRTLTVAMADVMVRDRIERRNGRGHDARDAHPADPAHDPQCPIRYIM